jgi:hypothetical protein
MSHETTEATRPPMPDPLELTEEQMKSVAGGAGSTGSWTGHWTWEGNKWVWTWVWNAGS